jgi:hypothetical protein
VVKVANIISLEDIFSPTGLLAQVGFYSFLLPVLLIWVLIFALLETLGIFKDEEKKPNSRVNTIVALVIALFIGANPAFRTWFSLQLMPLFTGYTGVVLVGILFLLLILGMLGITSSVWQNKSTWIIIAAILIVFLIFRGSGGFRGPLGGPDIVIGGISLPIIIVWAIIIGLILLVAWATGLLKIGGEKKGG